MPVHSPADRGLHARRGLCRRGRRAAGADHGLRLARRASSSTARPTCCWCWSSAAPAGSMAASPAPSSSSCCRTRFASLTPQYWMFWIGLFLVVLVLVGRERLSSAACCGLLAHGAAAMSVVAGNPRAWASASAASSPPTTSRSSLERGARQALIGPNGAGKTTFVNLLTGVLAAVGRTGAAGGRGHHAAQARGRACAAAWCAPSRSTSCSAISRRWRRWRWRSTSGWARRATGGRRVGAVAAVSAEVDAGRRAVRPRRRARPAHRHLALRQAAAARDRRRPSPARRGCCCSTSRRPACPRPSGATSSTPSPPCRPTCRCC